MTKIDTWPPPDWSEVVVLWKDIMDINFSGRARQMLDWVENTPGGRYHLHGYKSTEGFAFRFENPVDATHFRMVWK
jgi:hypothetical protein